MILVYYCYCWLGYQACDWTHIRRLLWPRLYQMAKTGITIATSPLGKLGPIGVVSPLNMISHCKVISPFTQQCVPIYIIIKCKYVKRLFRKWCIGWMRVKSIDIAWNVYDLQNTKPRRFVRFGVWVSCRKRVLCGSKATVSSNRQLKKLNCLGMPALYQK